MGELKNWSLKLKEKKNLMKLPVISYVTFQKTDLSTFEFTLQLLKRFGDVQEKTV